LKGRSLNSTALSRRVLKPSAKKYVVCLVSAFVIRISSFDLAFHIPNGRESRNRLANSREFGRGDYFINVLIGRPGFLGETGR
jgi:hypothetical protein